MRGIVRKRELTEEQLDPAWVQNIMSEDIRIQKLNKCVYVQERDIWVLNPWDSPGYYISEAGSFWSFHVIQQKNKGKKQKNI